METQNIQKFFDTCNTKKILVIGDVMIDAYVWGKVERISPEAPVPIVSLLRKEYRLGGAANVALNLWSLGAIPILAGIIGNDDYSATFLKIMQENHLSNEGIFIVKNRPTTVKTRIIGGNQQLLRIDEETTDFLEKSLEEAFLRHILKLFSLFEFDAIIFQDYDKGSLTPFLISEIVRVARQKNIPVLVDPKRRNFNSYRQVTLFKPNFKEFCEGLNIKISKNDFNTLFQVGKKFITEQQIEYLLLTLSEKGIILVTSENYYHIPAHVRDIADVSGAGDTVISVSALGFVAPLTPYQVAAIANLAGGLVCEKVGVVPITREMLYNHLITCNIL